MQTSRTVTSGPTDVEVKDMLRETIEFAEEEEARERQLEEERKDLASYYTNWLKTFTKHDVETGLDSVMGFVICANAIFIGLSMDQSEKSGGWLAADIAFSAAFLLELVSKVCLKGFRGQYCSGSRGNILDACLVLIDVAQLILTSSIDDSADLPSASLFRLLRLLKLARVLSVLRTDAFRDLLTMIQGMLGGLSTLLWSMVLFFLTIYMVSLVFRELFGRGSAESVNPFFDSVPRSILTTFRCSFGDCSTSGGTPLFEHIHTEFGGLASILCCCFVFVITIGLFNVISAIFVESTMLAAMSLETTKRRARLADKRLWCTRLTVLIRRLLAASPDHEIPEKMSECIEELYEIDLPGSIISEFVKDPQAISALDDLEIDPEDHEFLSDILDPDNSGSVGLFEFVDGLRRLRGVPRRSDIVAVDLMVRSIQKHLLDVEGMVRQFTDAVRAPCSAFV